MEVEKKYYILFLETFLILLKNHHSNKIFLFFNLFGGRGEGKGRGRENYLSKFKGLNYL